MSIALTLAARKARMTGLRNQIDLGTGQFLFYTGTPPATPDLAADATLLGTIVLAVPCGALGESATQALLTFTVPQFVLAIASGVIGWVRIANAAGDKFMDLPCGLSASAAPVILSALQVFTGGEIRLLSAVLAE